ncbi:hypothetical protein IPM19_04755 [bacterium]|nr:MAG: hypothetical protein IPM19_04755 [bacterium]
MEREHMSIGSEVRGNPQYLDQEQESAELHKVQLRQKIESLQAEIDKANDRLAAAESDEMIDKQAADELLDNLTSELDKLQSEWKDKYGSETVH